MDNIEALARTIWAAAFNDERWLLITVCILVVGIVVTELWEFFGDRKPKPGCGFCTSARNQPLTRVVRRWRWRGVVALETINPVVPGHIVVVARRHTRDAGDNPRVAARVMRCAAELVAEMPAANIITSKGPAATQWRYFHFHAHVVPRRHGDGLALPWTGQVIEQEDVVPS